MKKAGVSLYLRSDSHKELVDGIINENPEITSHSIPEQDDWLNGEVVKPYAFEKSWEEARNDPWVIFHTSGTTGEYIKFNTMFSC